MRMLLMSLAVACIATDAFGETNKQRRVRTPEERAAMFAHARMKRTGGIVRRPGSAKGTFVVLNAQKRISESKIAFNMDAMKDLVDIQYAVKPAEGVTVGNVGQKIAEAGGTIGVALVDDKALPSLLTAPETRWSIVNVAKLAENCKDEATVAARIRKEIFRSLAFTTGSIYATKADPLMRDVTKPGDLDGLRGESFGFETLSRFIESAPLYGLKPWYVSTYREACEAGWAPAPTNDVQKAIWDKVHAVPKNPMKIEFDPKKGR